MKIIFNPQKQYLYQIENWLEIEFKKDGKGFFHNFDIEDFTDNNFLCCVNENDEAIGFMFYSRSVKHCTIDIASVKQSEKRKGVCKTMLKALSDRLLERGTYVLNLFCSPVSSEKVWKKLGFKFYKEKENQYFYLTDEPVNYLYKTLVENLNPTRKKSLTTFVQLWTQDEYLVNSNPTIKSLIWNLENQQIPIIFPAEGEWKLRYVENGNEIYNGVLKRNVSGFFLYDDFLIYDKI